MPASPQNSPFLAWALCRNAYDMLNDPYRVREAKLVDVGSHIEIENYTIVKQEEQFYGVQPALQSALKP